MTMIDPVTRKWVGWGPGDDDIKVREIKRFLNRKFTWVRNWQPPLDDTTFYDENLTVVVGQMQANYGLPVTGIMDYTTQVKCGFFKPIVVTGPDKRPIFITVEGHMADPFIGPSAFIARDLEKMGLVWHQPIVYNNRKLPFD